MTNRVEFGCERTACGCENCRKNCRFMPGFLLPSDLERMIPAGVNPLQWADGKLLASPGALVAKREDGQVVQFRIPTLVPATKGDGTCVNLTAEGQCAIHAIAPFGCAFFDCGPETPGLAAEGLKAVMRAWQEPETSLYTLIWIHLKLAGHQQHSPDVLRARMQRAQ